MTEKEVGSKRHLTRQEEFSIMALILDKFLWMGVGIMGYGFWLVLNPFQQANVGMGLLVMLGGAVLLIVFMRILMKEYYFMKE
jgi:hypothetical protein